MTDSGANPSLADTVINEYNGAITATGTVRSTDQGLDEDDYRFDRWDFQFTTYADHPDADDDQQALLGTASVFVVHGTGSADDIVDALDELSEEALELALGLRRGKIRFDDLLEASFEQTLHDDVLILDNLHIESAYRTLPLLRDFVNAVLAGPAGRRAVYVVGAPASWDIAADADTAVEMTNAARFVRWADTEVFIRAGNNVDPVPAEASLEPEPTPGAALKVEFSTIIIGAVTRPRIHVAFPVPPNMAEDVARGRPAGDILIEDEGHSLAIVVPDSAEDAEDGDESVFNVTFKADGRIVLEEDVDDDLNQWLLNVAERHRTHMPQMLAAIDQTVEQILNGSAKQAASGSPAVAVLDVRLTQPRWIRDTEIEFTIDDTAPDGEASFIAFENRDDGTQVRIGAVRSRTHGSVEASIDQVAPVTDEESEAALNYLADTGTRALLAGTLANNLRDAARRAVLGLPGEDAGPLNGWQDIFGTGPS